MSMDIDAAAAQLMDQWSALAGQATGPSATGRADIPAQLQATILSDRKRFRHFVRRPLFWVNPQHVDLMNRWQRKYNLRAGQLRKALPRTETLTKAARPRALPKRADLLPSGPSVATWAALALGTYLYLSKR